MKMPVLESDDTNDWIYRVERFFAVNGLTEEERLIAAGLCLEGRAPSWYKYTDKQESIRTWW